LGWALAQSQSQWAVLPIDWDRFLTSGLWQRSPFLVDFLPQTEQLKQPTAAPSLEFLNRWQQAAPQTRNSLLLQHIQSQVSQILGLEPSQLPDPHQGFSDMGMDSLMAVELKHRLEQSLALKLSSTLVFNYPTIKSLVQYLIQEVLPPSSMQSQQQIADDWRLISSLQEIVQLSESELITLIAQEFEACR
jgi:acyl carrier protein